MRDRRLPDITTMLPSAAKVELTNYFLLRLEESARDWYNDPTYRLLNASQDTDHIEAGHWAAGIVQECFNEAYKRWNTRHAGRKRPR